MIKVVIPTTEEDKEMATKNAALHKLRAGIECEVVVRIDKKKIGWVAMHNKEFKKGGFDFYVYSCADYYPGRNWLKKAISVMLKEDYGLVGFNDGKWDGAIATVGLVKKEWIDKIYDGNLFYHGFKSHYADTEITAMAFADKTYGYCPHAVLIEVDYDKEKKCVNKQDRELFWERGHGKRWGLG